MDADALSRENAHLKARLAEVEAALAEVQEANRRLEDILRTSQRETFGRRSKKLSPDQFNLPLEDAELAQGVLEAAQEKAEAAVQRARGEIRPVPAARPTAVAAQGKKTLVRRSGSGDLDVSWHATWGISA